MSTEKNEGPKITIDGPTLTISVIGKPKLKAALEKSCYEHNKNNMIPLSITEYSATLLEKALTK